MLGQENEAVARWLQESGLYALPPEVPEYAFQVPVTVHIVRTDDGISGISEADADATIQAVSDAFEPLGMQFYRAGPFLYINDDDFFFIDDPADINALKGVAVIPDTINLYLTQLMQFTNPDGSVQIILGQSSFSFSPVQGIALMNAAATAPNNASVAVHEFGHYFDLYHTHENLFGIECPDGSNCAIAGDFLCDTPADPTLDTSNVVNCAYVGTEMMCGQTPMPDPSNFMSYADPACLDRFSSEQETRALATLVNIRTNLIQPPGLGVTWVDFTAPNFGTGSYFQPFDTLTAAVVATAPGGTVVIRGGGSCPVPLVVSKPLVLESFQEPAVIGN